MQRLIREQDAPRPSTRFSSLGDTATSLAGNRGLDVKRLVQLLAGDLDWVVMKALEKDRNRRYDTPGSFAEDIATLSAPRDDRCPAAFDGVSSPEVCPAKPGRGADRGLGDRSAAGRHRRLWR